MTAPTKMRVLSLFSGIGCHDYGLEMAGMEIVGQVEIDEFCQRALKKHFPKAKKWGDICGLSVNDIRRACRTIDLVTGSWPCQDISAAGEKKGIKEGQRSGLWREMWRIVRDLRPRWLLLENVPALRFRGGDSVLYALEMLGYTCWPLVVGAWGVGASHRRDRVWIVAKLDNAASARNQGRGECGNESQKSKLALASSLLANAFGSQFEGGEGGGIATNQESRRRSNNSGSDVANADSQPVRKQRQQPTRTQQAPVSFPLGQGTDQHEWEEPRVIRTLKCALGSADARDARQLARWNNAALAAAGNGNPPHVPFILGLAIKALEADIDGP